MKKAVAAESASALSASASIDEKVKELGDWRGKTLAKVRGIVHAADPDMVEEWKWAKATSPGVPVWSHDGIVCTGETYKNAVKMTFANGAALKDPSGLFNSSLEGNVRRAIDIHEGDKINEMALKDLIRAAVALNHQKQAEAQAKIPALNLAKNAKLESCIRPSLLGRSPKFNKPSKSFVSVERLPLPDSAIERRRKEPD